MAGAGAGMYLHNISTQCPKKDNSGKSEEWGPRNLRMSPTLTPAMANQHMGDLSTLVNSSYIFQCRGWRGGGGDGSMARIIPADRADVW